MSTYVSPIMATRNRKQRAPRAAPRRGTYAAAPVKPRKTPSAPMRITKGPSMFQTGGEALGEVAGSLIPVPGAAAVGKFLGGKLGHLISEITGFGDYKVAQNSIMQGGMSHPQIVNSVENGGFLLRFREYIGDIQSSIAYVNRPYIIQPGNPQTFPWLSSIATNFEQYRLRGILFEFNSTSSDALISGSLNGALGSVIMSTDYDIADAPPTSKRQALNSIFSCSEKPSKSFIHPIECKKALSAQNILYTRNAAVPPGFDPRLYDFARFNIATEGMQSDTGSIGELWVTYEIEFMKQATNSAGLADHFYMNGVTTSRPLGSSEGSSSNGATNLARGGTLGGLILPDFRTYAFPTEVSTGNYLVCYSLNGVSAASVIPASISTLTRCSLVNAFTGSLSNFVASPNPAATSQCCMRTVVVKVTAQNASFGFDVTNGNPPAAVIGDLYVVRLPDSMLF